MFNVSNEMVPLNFLIKVTSRLCICCCCDWFSLSIRLHMHPFSRRWKLGFYLENVDRHYGFSFIPCSMVPWIITHKKKVKEISKYFQGRLFIIPFRGLPCLPNWADFFFQFCCILCLLLVPFENNPITSFLFAVLSVHYWLFDNIISFLRTECT